MSVSLHSVRSLAGSMFPELKSIIEHDSEATRSTWSTGLENGKAIELLSLCALAASIVKLGLHIEVPELFERCPDLFYLRNVLPRHHGAQAGHEGSIDNIPLQERFLAALTPKLIIKKDNCEYGIFREGFPIHLIDMLYKGKPEYLDRADILVVEGCVSISVKLSGEASFSYTCSAGSCDGVLRIKNDIRIPLISYSNAFATKIPTVGIIECSIGKGKERAEEQLCRYLTLFAGANPPATLLINGKKQRCAAYDTELFIDLKNDDIESLRDPLVSCMDVFIRKALSIS